MTTQALRAQHNGQCGEQIAAEYLRQNGYTIHATNWRMTGGELDIVASKDNVMTFVEVRTRSANNTESAFASVTKRKQALLERAVYHYLDAHQLDNIQWQIDIIAIAMKNSQSPIIEHVENALDW